MPRKTEIRRRELNMQRAATSKPKQKKSVVGRGEILVPHPTAPRCFIVKQI